MVTASKQLRQVFGKGCSILSQLRRSFSIAQSLHRHAKCFCTLSYRLAYGTVTHDTQCLPCKQPHGLGDHRSRFPFPIRSVFRTARIQRQRLLQQCRKHVVGNRLSRHTTRTTDLNTLKQPSGKIIDANRSQMHPTQAPRPACRLFFRGIAPAITWSRQQHIGLVTTLPGQILARIQNLHTGGCGQNRTTQLIKHSDLAQRRRQGGCVCHCAHDQIPRALRPAAIHTLSS